MQPKSWQGMNPMLDPTALERLKDWGGPALAAKMVRLFLDTSPDRVAQVKAAFDGGPVEDAERGAHSLKSSAANLGATRLREVSATMENLLSAEDVDGARDLFGEFEEEHTRTLTALEALESELV